MPSLTLIRLTKSFGANNMGEICGFTADTATHILKNQGGEVIAEDFDPKKHLVVEGEDGQVSVVDAELELVDGKPTGNLVPKKVEPKKADPKPPAK